MSQHDMNIANQAGAAVRADLNLAIAALVTNSSGSTAPTTTFAYQFWVDTSGSSPILKIRDGANAGWVSLGAVDASDLGKLTALTGDVVASGGGSQSATIQNGVVTNAKLANVITQTLKGRASSGTGAPEDLTAVQATAILNAVVGDSGSGGTKGLVPAPASGDAAAGKFLKADGTFAVPGYTIPSSTVTGSMVASNINLPGNAVQENGRNVVVSNTNDTTSLCIVRGKVNSNASVAIGVGWSATIDNSPSTNNYHITFTTPFSDVPVVCANAFTTLGNEVVIINSVTSSGFVAQSVNASSNAATIAWNFIAIGQR
jgi:hypothetical protein